MCNLNRIYSHVTIDHRPFGVLLYIMGNNGSDLFYFDGHDNVISLYAFQFNCLHKRMRILKISDA